MRNEVRPSELSYAMEIGNALSRPSDRATAVHIITQLQRDPDTLVVRISDGPLLNALEMFVKYDDKNWGLVDCISFQVMR
jgi:hypothetical protein